MLGECDTANGYLAGHEKKIECIKFHSRNPNIVATSSADHTIRIWDVANLQDNIVLELPNETNATGLTFDCSDNLIICGTSDGAIHLYDPRAQNFPMQVSVKVTSLP